MNRDAWRIGEVQHEVQVPADGHVYALRTFPPALKIS